MSLREDVFSVHSKGSLYKCPCTCITLWVTALAVKLLAKSRFGGGGGRGRNWVDATPLGVKISDLVLHRLFLD